jgi:hypothetical protein
MENDISRRSNDQSIIEAEQQIKFNERFEYLQKCDNQKDEYAKIIIVKD